MTLWLRTGVELETAAGDAQFMRYTACEWIFAGGAISGPTFAALL